jgi:hypothetical protein
VTDIAPTIAIAIFPMITPKAKERSSIRYSHVRALASKHYANLNSPFTSTQLIRRYWMYCRQTGNYANDG